MGLVVGDALGVPVEFEPRDTFEVNDMIGYGTYKQPAGTWSDDSSMTLATLESIVKLGHIDLDDIMHNFYEWIHHSKFTAHGAVFDYGITTHQAIMRYIKGEAPQNCGGSDITDNGNGALMRILPIVFISHTESDIDALGALTHGHIISKMGCRLYIDIAEQLLQSKNIEDIVLKKDKCVEEYYRVRNIKNLNRNEIKSTGYVVDSLEAAIWCLYTTDNYRDCVLKAVNLGGDTDTIAAVVGGLAGLLYGCGGKKGIPNEWIAQIARKEWIEQLCQQAEQKLKKI